jgi:hypothetical protein
MHVFSPLCSPAAFHYNDTVVSVREESGVRLLITFFLVAVGSSPAFAGEACDAEFGKLMRQENAGFPYAANIRTEFAGSVTEVPVVVLNAEHSMTLDDQFGQRYITKGNRIWSSTDKGASWKLAATLPEDTVTKSAAMLERQASKATDIVCTDSVGFGDQTFRLVQGNFLTDGTNLPAVQKFFTTGANQTWQVAVTELTIAGKPSVVTTTKHDSEATVTIPEMEQ